MFPGLWMILPEPKWRHCHQLPNKLCIQLIRTNALKHKTLHSSAICYYSVWLRMFIPTDHKEWNVLSHYTQRIGSIHNPYALFYKLYHKAILDVFSYYHIALYTMQFLFFLHSVLLKIFPISYPLQTCTHVYYSDGSSIISQCKSIFDLRQCFN